MNGALERLAGEADLVLYDLKCVIRHRIAASQARLAVWSDWRCRPEI
jgi:hypothetical protein